MQPERLLERFLRYVRIESTANDSAGVYPSSPGQLVLGKLLAAELQTMGLAEVEQDAKGLVWATVRGTNGKRSPVVAFNAHLDTSPETSGKDIQPQVIRKYGGGDIVLPKNPQQVILVKENPELERLVGSTLVTTDGTTLLGADDKAGVAVIMEMAQHLAENPDISHGDVKILFTCDEEIGHGVDHVNLAKLGATAAYTLDGAGAGEIDTDTFSADLAIVTVRGKNIHPSIAKDRMVNAIRGAGRFLDRMPREGMSPETTDGWQGFLHPYTIEGGVAEVRIKILLRSFITSHLAPKAELLRRIAIDVEEELGAKVDVQVIKQYRNMAEGLGKEPRAVELAEQAYRKLGLEPKRTIIRGGTDGSQFTERGLPCPNLSTGEHNPHSPLEWTCLEEMCQAVNVLVELVKLWGEQPELR